MTNAIIQLPRASIEQINHAVDHYNTLVHFVRRSLREKLDYGKIQGCGDKPVLFKPGAEKIATLFGFRESLERLEAVKDWTGKDFGGEPFFSFEYKCTLRDRGGVTVAECVGSCNSWEDKYRYRKAERTCPNCGAAAIIKGKSQYGGGWLCYKQKDGCGAKFADGDAAIEAQEVGKVRNERIYDQVNTIDKMAQKRAFVGAVILAANASNFFSVEHSELSVIDVALEPLEDIDVASTLERFPVELVDDTPVDMGQVNRDRISFFLRFTGHTRQEVKLIAGGTAEEMGPEDMQRLIDLLLVDMARTRHVTEPIATALLTEIRKEQPNITDEHLLDRFMARCGEALSEAPQAARTTRQPTTVGGISIE